MIKAVAGKPGLWRAPGWKQSMPGLYALIVGVGDYPHLIGGGGPPATDAYSLGQLPGSSLTAVRIFEWLRDKYEVKGLPLVWCGLLLSPTKEQKASLSKLNYAPATNRSIRDFIDEWTGVAPAPAKGSRSRTFFFFSGHGVAANWSPLILPADYLNPTPATRLQNCISIREMKDWMLTSAAPEHLAVIDACRNEFSPLASKGATALTAFQVAGGGGPGATAVATFQSTSPDQESYQGATAPMTFFGQALLEGLQGNALRGNSLAVDFHSLVAYVKPRVTELLSEKNETLEQTGYSTLEPSDATVVVAELAKRPRKPRPRKAVAPKAGKARRGAGGGGKRRAIGRPPKFASALELGQLVSASSAIKTQLAVDVTFQKPVGNLRPTISDLRQFSVAHERFGSEDLSDVWVNGGFKLVEIQSGQTIGGSGGGLLVDASKLQSGRLVRADLLIEPGSGGVLAVFEEKQSQAKRGRLALPLPRDPYSPVPISLSLMFSPNTGQGRSLERVEARTGRGDGAYRYLWELSAVARFGSLADLAEKADLGRLRGIVEDKQQFPVAAIAATLLVARGGRIRRLDDWPRNLMNRFPAYSDGAILWAEAVRSAHARGETKPFDLDNPLDEIGKALGRIKTSGAPYFAASYELADYLMGYFARETRRSPRRSTAQAKRIKTIMSIARPAGHFVMVSGLPRPRRMKGTGPLSIEEFRQFFRGAD